MDEKKEVMQQIETKAEEQTRAILSTTTLSQAGPPLQEVMKTGMDDFRAKMGRNPTYSEMRQMFG
jgi:hypothetical protein